ncbi:NfeD family protein [Massilia sp. R2A-15]|uniref:NfeD family protein n=1 Tax=Massilia sp. R2A-15 TaxID=3064278 RepID=UPI0027369FD6|nr:NfeD family protein [Massilia sp. R2A-15]WLI91427.1 NfeD family protein [Massilia sp. R2A-15]
MADWINWLVAAGVLVVMELFTGTFYLLMIAIGMAFGALAAYTGQAAPMQFIAAAAVGVLATGLLHRSRFGKPSRGNAARDPNVNIDIGQRIDVPEWHGGKARVMYRGALWDVELGQGAIAEAGVFKIVEIQGSRLIVTGA